MPTFDVTIQGKQYHVEIPDPGAAPLQVVVDGQPFEVHVSGTGFTAAPVQTGDSIAPAQRPVAPRPAPQPTPLPPMPNVQVARPVAPVGGNAGATGGHDVHAPMPGTIISIAVKPGQQVEAGTVVCVLEAMKMKNPIRVNVAATIGEVLVQTGQAVAYGDVLVRLA